MSDKGNDFSPRAMWLSRLRSTKCKINDLVAAKYSNGMHVLSHDKSQDGSRARILNSASESLIAEVELGSIPAICLATGLQQPCDVTR